MTIESEKVKLPRYVQLEPVGQCNLRCQMCPIQFREDGPPYGPPAFMPFETFTGLIDQFDNLETLHLQGLGEPMMHPRFFEMVDYAATKGIRVTTNSNLTLLNQKRAERCIQSDLAELHISIDGATPETYESIRVRSHFDRIMRNLGFLQEASQRLGLPGPKLQLVVVVMRCNLHELPDLVRLAHRWSMAEIFVQHLCHDFGESSLPAKYRPMRDFVEQQTLLEENPGRVAHYFFEAKQVAADLGIPLRLPPLRQTKYLPGTPGRQRCDWPWSGGYISYQGIAMPCCMIATPDRANFGNMAQEGVEAVWNGESANKFRQALDSDCPPEICRSCALYAGTF